MLLPKSLAKFNRHVTNKVVGPIAKVMPLLGVVHHVGRKSGRQYTTPVTAIAHHGEFVIPLTYGRDTDWVKNVVAAGGCHFETRGRIMEMSDPQFLPTGEGLRAMPTLFHLVLARLEVEDFLRLRIEESD
ncbi:MAG: nitroreductase family deazaflavin-dependent oxidoreductase [Gammaproteobacteria bacterium]|nr:nitroreductase family deazaflavin-dependent oxidoreductase [Gammaproteobacteria bacterium]